MKPDDRRSLLATAAVTVAFLALAWRWLSFQDLPDGSRDEFFLVEVVTDWAWRLRDGSGGSVLPAVLQSYYPPLARLPGVIALLLGGGLDALVASQWGWVPIGVFGTWWAARRLAGPWAGLAAAILWLSGPVVIYSLHHFEPNLGQMAAGAAVLAAWLESDDFRRFRPTLAFAAFLALGMLVERLGLVPFVLVPIALSAWRGRRDRATRHGLAIVAGVCLVAVGWWYRGFLTYLVTEMVPQMFAGETTAQGDVEGEVLALPWRWTQYLVLLPDTQLGLLGGLIGLGGLGWGLSPAGRRAGAGDVVVWAGAGLLLFTLLTKRQVFYTLPVLPAVCALGAAALVQGARKVPGGAVFAGLILLLGAVPAVVMSGPRIPDWEPGMRTWAVLGVSPLPEWLVGPRYAIAAPPRDQGLGIAVVAGWLREQGIRDDEPILVFAADTRVTDSYLVSLFRIERRTAEVISFTLQPDAVLERSAEARALIYVTRDERQLPDAEQVRAAHEAFFGWQEQYAPLLEEVGVVASRATEGFKRPLAEGETLWVWRLAPVAQKSSTSPP